MPKKRYALGDGPVIKPQLGRTALAAVVPVVLGELRLADPIGLACSFDSRFAGPSTVPISTGRTNTGSRTTT